MFKSVSYLRLWLVPIPLHLLEKNSEPLSWCYVQSVMKCISYENRLLPLQARRQTWWQRSKTKEKQNKTKYFMFSMQKRRTKKTFKFKIKSKFSFHSCIWNLKMLTSNNAYMASGQWVPLCPGSATAKPNSRCTELPSGQPSNTHYTPKTFSVRVILTPLSCVEI